MLEKLRHLRRTGALCATGAPYTRNQDDAYLHPVPDVLSVLDPNPSAYAHPGYPGTNVNTHPNVKSHGATLSHDNDAIPYRDTESDVDRDTVSDAYRHHPDAHLDVDPHFHERSDAHANADPNVDTNYPKSDVDLDTHVDAVASSNSDAVRYLHLDANSVRRLERLVTPRRGGMPWTEEGFVVEYRARRFLRAEV